MSGLCGWLPADPCADGARVVAAMGRALRVSERERWAQWAVAGCHVGLLDAAAGGDDGPAVSPDGRYHLWMAGEVYSAGSIAPAVTAASSRTRRFRRLVLEALLERGETALLELDGEYQIALLDGRDRALRLFNDRFGGLPLYWGRSADGFAFAGGVRGVLMAPGIPADPDPEALREAVTFGGFRLADRTNVAAVKMLPGATAMTAVAGRVSHRRYWSWRDLPSPPAIARGWRARAVRAAALADAVDRLHAHWQQAVRRRLGDEARVGQTLSGGLDSRAILAEAAPLAPTWTAITYGVPGCDDALFAERAARTAGVTWVFHPLYSGRDPDWLERRLSHVQATDGLIQLADLMHLECAALQAGLIDVHFTGYIGDAVVGPTFAAVADADGVLAALPFYGTRIGLDEAAARARVESLIAGLDGAPARYAVYEHKLPQSTNRWAAAWRPYARVRKPFTDYALFDFCHALPAELRRTGELQARWLAGRYPAFAAIPNQRTGAPVTASRWGVLAERARRQAWRTAQPALAALGLPARPRIRAYHADDLYWRLPRARSRIESTVLRPGSLVCEILGRRPVTSVVRDWFDHGRGPAQVIGALLVYEAYHAGLGHHLREARKE